MTTDPVPAPPDSRDQGVPWHYGDPLREQRHLIAGTALVDLSETFRAACQGMGQAEERNMVYAMVNTLTEMDGVTRVRFYVNGEPSPLAGWLFMEGEFLRHPGLIRE